MRIVNLYKLERVIRRMSYTVSEAVDVYNIESDRVNGYSVERMRRASNFKSTCRDLLHTRVLLS